MNQSLYELIQKSTVRLVLPDESDWGTGFFVGQGMILTCAHVVAGYEDQPISVQWQGKNWGIASVVKVMSESVDLALLQCELPPSEEHPPCVLLDEEFQPFDRLYIYGYTDDFPQGAGVTVQCEGDATEQGVRLIKFQSGQIRPGHSGAPVLNEKTGKVCGLVSDTRGRSTNLGGLAVSIIEAALHFPELKLKNKQFHEYKNRRNLKKELSLCQEKISSVKCILYKSFGDSQKGAFINSRDFRDVLQEVSDIESRIYKTIFEILERPEDSDD